MKILYTSVLLFFCMIQIHAQVSIGLKGGVNYSTYTDKNYIGLISEITDLDDQLEEFRFDAEKGIAFAGLLQLEFNKYISIIFEPGFSKRDGHYAPEESIFIDVIFPPGKAQRIYIELPLKFKLRAPLLKDKLGIYSTVGISPEKYLYTKLVSSSNGSSAVVSSREVGEFFEDWSFNRMIGIGFDVKMGLHRLLLACDFSTQMQKNSFSDARLKDVALGVGYLYEL